jgi:hypothetical protein
MGDDKEEMYEKLVSASKRARVFLAAYKVQIKELKEAADFMGYEIDEETGEVTKKE